jgi:hypothetical protein
MSEFRVTVFCGDVNTEVFVTAKTEKEAKSSAIDAVRSHAQTMTWYDESSNSITTVAAPVDDCGNLISDLVADYCVDMNDFYDDCYECGCCRCCGCSCNEEFDEE